MSQIRNNTGLKWQSTDGEGQEFMKRQYISNEGDKEQCYQFWQIADNNLQVFLQGLSFVVFCQRNKLIIDDEEIPHYDGRVGVFEASKLSSISRQAGSHMHQDTEQLKKFMEWIIIHSQCCVQQHELIRVTRVRAIKQKTYWQSKQSHHDHEWLSSTFPLLQNWRPISLPEHDYCVADCSQIQWMNHYLSFRTSYPQTVLTGKRSEREFSKRQAKSAVVPAHVWSLFAFTA